MSNYRIPIERLTAGNEIFMHDSFYGPHSFGAEVMAVEFDGEGYLVKARIIDEDKYGDSYASEREAEEYYLPGSTVGHCYEHEPRWMRSRAAVTAEEWKALEEAKEMEE